MKEKVLFALNRNNRARLVPGSQEWDEVERQEQPFSSRTDFGQLEQRVHVLHPQTPGHMKSLHSFPWKDVPGGPNGYKILYFSLSIPIMTTFISTCSHNNSGLCLTKLVLNCMSSCICLPLHLRWAVALRFGLASEVFHSLNNMDAIQTPLKSTGILQLTHRP